MTDIAEQYRQMHAAGHFAGMSTLDWADDIGAMLKEHGCVSVLDYGSGKGRQYTEAKIHEKWGVPMPTLYDPGAGINAGMFEFINNSTDRYDAVICCDVLEHLEGKELLRVVGDVLSLANRAAFFAVSCRPAKKLLPDGRNCHLTIQPPTWWNGYIAATHDQIVKGKRVVVTRFET